MARMVAVKTADKAQSVLVEEWVGCSCCTLMRYSLNEHMSQSKQPAAKLLSPIAFSLLKTAATNPSQPVALEGCRRARPHVQ